MGKSNNWKKVEYKVAEKLGGRRVPVSGRAKGFKGDIEHEKYFIEVKSGRQIPKKVLKWDKEIELGYKILKEKFDGILRLEKTDIPKKILKWIKKTEEECPKGKKPLLIMKPRYCHKEFVMWKSSSNKFYFTTLDILVNKNKV